MKILSRRDIYNLPSEETSERYLALHKFTEKHDLLNKLNEKYTFGGKDVEGYIDVIISNSLFPIADRLEQLNNKSFLDLGCGSINPKNQSGNFFNRQYEPWLCRVLHELGVKVIGVDINNLDGEEFEHYSIDLIQENSLNFLTDSSVDLAHASKLYIAPNLWARYGFPADVKLNQNLLPQLERIVKEKGYFIHDYNKTF